MARDGELNYCPHCGGALANREAFERIRRFCPSCDRIVFREHKVVAGVVVENEGRVLLVRRRYAPRKGAWSLPAGFVDSGEDPVAAAVRECREETGLSVEVTGILDVIAGREHPRGADIVIVYQAVVVGGRLQSGDDADEVAFFSPESLPELAFLATAQAVAHWRDGRLRSST